MARYRHATRVAKETVEIMDEIVEAMMNGLTPEQIRRELEEWIWQSLEKMTDQQLGEEMEKHEISAYHDIPEPEEREEW